MHNYWKSQCYQVIAPNYSWRTIRLMISCKLLEREWLYQKIFHQEDKNEEIFEKCQKLNFLTFYQTDISKMYLEESTARRETWFGEEC